MGIITFQVPSGAIFGANFSKNGLNLSQKDTFIKFNTLQKSHFTRLFTKLNDTFLGC